MVLAHSPLEEVGLALQRDHLHPVEGVLGAPHLSHSQRHQQPVSHALDVLRHQLRVYPDQVARQALGNELLLDLHRLPHDLLNQLGPQPVLHDRVEVAGEVGVQSLVAGDELVRKGQPGHQGALLEPENGAEGAREEDAFDCGEGDEALVEGAVPVHPLHGPLRLLPDHVDVRDGREEVVLLVEVLNVGVDEEGVGLGVDVLHGDLKTVEAARLGDLHFRAELLSKVLEHDAVRGCEEGEHVFDEVFFVGRELLPVFEVLVEVYFVGSPEGGEVLFVHFVDGVILDREEDKALWVLSKNGFLNFRCSEGGSHSFLTIISLLI